MPSDTKAVTRNPIAYERLNGDPEWARQDDGRWTIRGVELVGPHSYAGFGGTDDWPADRVAKLFAATREIEQNGGAIRSTVTHEAIMGGEEGASVGKIINVRLVSVVARFTGGERAQQKIVVGDQINLEPTVALLIAEENLPGRSVQMRSAESDGSEPHIIGELSYLGEMPPHLPLPSLGAPVDMDQLRADAEARPRPKIRSAATRGSDMPEDEKTEETEETTMESLSAAIRALADELAALKARVDAREGDADEEDATTEEARSAPEIPAEVREELAALKRQVAAAEEERTDAELSSWIAEKRSASYQIDRPFETALRSVVRSVPRKERRAQFDALTSNLHRVPTVEDVDLEETLRQDGEDNEAGAVRALIRKADAAGDRAARATIDHHYRELKERRRLSPDAPGLKDAVTYILTDPDLVHLKG